MESEHQQPPPGGTPASPFLPGIDVTLSYPEPDVTVCTVTGEVDIATTPALCETLDLAIRDVRAHLVIDLSAIDYLGSAGLQALLDVLKRQRKRGHLAIVTDTNLRASRPFQVTALDEIFDLYDSVTDALRACAGAAS